MRSEGKHGKQHARALCKARAYLTGPMLMLAELLFFSGVCHAQIPDGYNLAQTTPYQLAPAPNYDLAKGVPDRVLTDGRIASGRFWVGADSVGWQWKSPIIYRQTFLSTQTVRRVELGTGQAARSEISVPANAFVYASGREGEWAYIGDAAKLAGSVAEGRHTLSLDFDPVKARSIAIVIYRNAPYVFLDEVRILAATGGREIEANIELGDVIGDAQRRRRAFAEHKAGTAPIGPDRSARTAWPLEHFETGGRGCLVTSIAPFTESDPAALMHAEHQDGDTSHAVGGWLVGLLRIVNSSNVAVNVAVNTRRQSGVGMPEAFAAKYVLALDYRWRADVLTPIQALVVPARSMSLVVVRAPVTSPGRLSAAIEVACAEARTEILINGRAVQIEDVDRPYGNTWSYLLGPSRQLSRCGSTIHDDAWINTAVVESAVLAPKRSPRLDAQLRSYLRTFARSRRLLLFMDLTSSAWVPDDGPQLEEQLKTWWASISAVIAEEAYKGEVLFYPIDEIRDGQFARLDAAIRILRRIAPAVSIYATIDNMPAALAVSSDVKQFHDSLLPQMSSIAAFGRSPQIYATSYYAKALGLSSYYRRMGWLAFGLGLDGAGIWSMWDANGADQPETGWLDFGGNERDFNLVYADRSGCPLMSRRLMAFQRGLEDFAIMRACARPNNGSRVQEIARVTAQSDKWSSLRRSAEQSVPAFDVALAEIVSHCRSVPTNDR